MRKISAVAGVGMLCIGALWLSAGAWGQDAEQVTKVAGLVRDLACPVKNLESTATRFNLQCAMACAKAGSPLILLAEDGTIYFPISKGMPDEDQRGRLMPFVGKYVIASGRVYERGGTKAIVLGGIEEDRSKKVTSDAFPQ